MRMARVLTRRSPCRSYRWACAAVLISLAGCDVLDAQACTLIGCTDGLTLELIGSHPSEFTLEIRVSRSATIVIECNATSPCESSIFLPDFTPGSVEVAVTSGTASSTQTFTPEYAELQPNGPECGPICLQAIIRVDV